MNDLKIKVIHNGLSQQYVDFINKELDPAKVPWTYIDSVSYTTEKTKLQMGLTNLVYSDDKILSNSYWYLYPILLETANKAGFFIEKLMRIRIGGYLSINTPNHKHVVHVDDDYPHIVALYYPHDTDGDTIFYDSKEGKNEIYRVSPRRGSIVFFDGSIYHSSSSPIEHNIRITLSFNFRGKWPE